MLAPVKSMDFCVVTSRKGLKGSGIEVGATVLVIALKTLPEKKSDPYLQRVYAVVGKVVDDKLQMPGEDNDYKTYLVDPRHLSVWDEDGQKKYNQLLEKQYEEKANVKRDTSTDN